VQCIVGLGIVNMSMLLLISWNSTFRNIHTALRNKGLTLRQHVKNTYHIRPACTVPRFVPTVGCSFICLFMLSLPGSHIVTGMRANPQLMITLTPSHPFMFALPAVLVLALLVRACVCTCAGGRNCVCVCVYLSVRVCRLNNVESCYLQIHTQQTDNENRHTDKITRRKTRKAFVPWLVHETIQKKTECSPLASTEEYCWTYIQCI
jgi:hypothetical protein